MVTPIFYVGDFVICKDAASPHGFLQDRRVYQIYETQHLLCKVDGSSIWWDSTRFELLKKEESCNHTWKEYIGLTESFKYCTLCDEKEKL